MAITLRDCNCLVQGSRTVALKPLGDKRRTCRFPKKRITWRGPSEIFRVEGPPVEFSIKPAQDADLGRAQSLQPTIDKEIISGNRGRNLLCLVDYRPGTLHLELVG